MRMKVRDNATYADVRWRSAKLHRENWRAALRSLELVTNGGTQLGAAHIACQPYGLYTYMRIQNTHCTFADLAIASASLSGR